MELPCPGRKPPLIFTIITLAMQSYHESGAMAENGEALISRRAFILGRERMGK
jgi:hypothetical protein